MQLAGSVLTNAFEGKESELNGGEVVWGKAEAINSIDAAISRSCSSSGIGSGSSSSSRSSGSSRNSSGSSNGGGGRKSRVLRPSSAPAVSLSPAVPPRPRPSLSAESTEASASLSSSPSPLPSPPSRTNPRDMASPSQGDPRQSQRAPSALALPDGDVPSSTANALRSTPAAPAASRVPRAPVAPAPPALMAPAPPALTAEQEDAVRRGGGFALLVLDGSVTAVYKEEQGAGTVAAAAAAAADKGKGKVLQRERVLGPGVYVGMCACVRMGRKLGGTPYVVDFGIFSSCWMLAASLHESLGARVPLFMAFCGWIVLPRR